MSERNCFSPENDRKCCQIIQWTQRLNKCRESGAGGGEKFPGPAKVDRGCGSPILNSNDFRPHGGIPRGVTGRRVISASAENRGNPCQGASNPAEIRHWARAAYRQCADQMRIVSVARIRLDSHKFMRAFKGIICDDISEFESHMPSHAVGLSQVRSPTGAYGDYHHGLLL